MKTGHYYCKVIARLCFRILENSCSPRSAVAERVNLLPPVADFEMKGNGEQPGLADKALASDKLLQDKAADRRVAGKAETDHRRL